MERLQKTVKRIPYNLHPDFFNVNILHYCGTFAETEKPTLARYYYHEP